MSVVTFFLSLFSINSYAQCTAVQNLNTGLSYCTIQAAINDPATLNGHTIVVAAGTYNESPDITKSITLKGAKSGVCAPTRSGAESVINCTTGITVNADNVVIDGFTITGQTDTTAAGYGFAINMMPPSKGTHVINNIIRNNSAGCSLTNSGALPPLVLISCNWFDNNNVPGPFASEGVFTNEDVSGGPVTNIAITLNKFSGHTDAGINFFNLTAGNTTSGVTIASNDFDGNGRAAFLSRVNNITFQNNLCHNSTLATSSDLRLFGSVTNLIAVNNSFIDAGNGVHAVRISGGQGMNSNATINNNSFVGYAADTAIWIINGYTGTLNAHCNWWNTNSNAAIAAQVVGPVDYMPWLSNGTDNSAAIGFQPVPNSCNGCPGGLITNVNTGLTYCTFQAAIDDPATLNGHTIFAPAAMYNESFNITKSVTLHGAQYGVCFSNHPGLESESIINCVNGIGISADNVVIDGFVIQGQNADSTGPGFGAAIRMNAPFNGTQILNNIIKDNMKGITVSNAGANPPAVQINCNWFDSNNNPSADSTSATPVGEGIFTDESVSGGAVSNVLITNNKFTNHTDAGVSFFNRIASNVSSSVSINNNEFGGNGRAAFLSRMNNVTFSANYCHNSTLATSADLRLFGGISNLTALNNSFVDGGNDVHALRLSNGQGPNTNVVVNENSFVGYAADTAIWIIGAGYTGTLNAHCNWWNTTSNAAIAAQVVGAVDYMPWLSNGTDTNPLIGFQPAAGSCNGCPGGLITNVNTGMTYCTFQAAIDDPATLNGHTISAPAGTYNESFNITKALNINGVQANTCAATRSGPESIINCVNGIGVSANNVNINGFTIQGQTADSTAPGYGAAIRLNAPFTGAHIVNNIIRNNMKGITLSNAGANPLQVQVVCNWFDSNNNAPNDSTSATPFGEGIFTDETVSGSPVSNVSIDNNKFTNHRDAGVTFFNTIASNASNLILITRNDFDGNGRAAFLSRVNNATFSGNYCHNSTLATSSDLRLFGGVNNLNAMNNSFVDAGNDVHALRISGGQGTNSNVLFNFNSMVGYASDTAVWIISGYTGTLNAHCNWWNTNSNAAIAAQVAGAVDYMPWLSNGTDNSPLIGFQPVPGSCNGCPGGLITNVNTGLTYCTFQAAIDDPATLNGHTISVPAGTYTESFNITKTLNINGAQANNCAVTRSGPESIINCVSGIGVSANNVYINGFTIQGQTADSTAPGFGAAIRMNAPFTGTHIMNNIIKNNMKGVTVSNAGSLPPMVLINCNWFDSNNNPSPDSTSATPFGEGIYSDETVSGGPVSQVTINLNKFTNHTDAGVTFFNRISSNVTSAMLIADNEFDGNGRAAFLSRVNNTTFATNYCHNSTLATSADLRLFGGVTNFIASRNSFVYSGNDVHALRLSNGQGANSNILVNENSFVGYAADTAIWIVGAGYTGTLNAHCNWWNTTNSAAIAAQVVGAVDYMPWLSNGTDNSPAIGFQPVPGSCTACPGGLITNLNTGITYCTFQAAIDDPSTLNGHVISAPAGTYNESFSITKSVTLKGAQADVCATSRAGAESIINCVNGIGINASNVVINGFTIQGQMSDTLAPGFGFAVYMAPPNTGTKLLNNIIRNNMAGSSLSNSGATQVLISCNWFDSNNNRINDTTRVSAAAGQGIYSDESSSGGPVSNVLITGNKFTSHADAGVTLFNHVSSNASSNISITSNDFDGNGRAAFLSRVNNSVFSSNLCHNSTLATSADLRLFGGVNNLTVLNNSFNDAGNDVHALRLSNGQGANTNVLVNENSFAGYAADTAIWIIGAGYTGTLNAHCNWWNTTNSAAIAAQVVGAVDYMPWLSNGTDNSTAIGFQPIPGSCNGCPAGFITNVNTGMQYCTFQAAIDDPATLNGHVLIAPAGTYNESFSITKSLILRGAQADVCATSRSGPETIINCLNGIGVNASNVIINGFTIQGQTSDTLAPGFGFAVYMAPPNTGTKLLNNIIRNNMAGSSLSNSGATQVLISCNWFDANNNRINDTTRVSAAAGQGIYSDESSSGGPVSNVMITGNRFTNHADAGITLFNHVSANASSNITITSNDFDGNGRAAFLSRVNNSTFSSNLCHNSTLATSADLRLFGGVNNLTALNNSFIDAGNDVHALRLSNGQGANTNVVVNENSFVGYAADTAIWIIGAGYTGTLNAHCNWWNTTSNAAIAAQVVGSVDYMPWLSNGTDNSASIGFQPVPNSCNGCPSGQITNLNTGLKYCTFQAAINDPATLNGHVLSAPAGTYNESFTITKSLILRGAKADVCATNRSGAETIINCVDGIGVNASNVTINGFTIQGQMSDTLAPGFGYAVYMSPPFTGTKLLNNIIKNNMKGASVSNAGTSPTPVLISCNWFDNNNNRAGDTTAVTVSGHGIHTDQTVSGGPVSKVTIDGNRFTNNLDAGVTFFNTIPSNVSKAITITNNDFDGNGRAAFLSRVDSSVFSSNLCRNSTLATSSDLRLFGGVNFLTAMNNSFVASANDVHAVRISNGQGNNSNVLLNYNSFVGYATDTAVWIINGYTGTLNAECNWWNTTNSLAIGAQVVGAVDYTPWLTNGTDASPAIGFQPVANSCNGTPVLTITCPQPVTVKCAGSVPPPSNTAVTVANSCGAYTVTWTGDAVSNQTCANKYTITRTYHVTDACNNSANCTQIITVNDDVAPTITCPAAITVKCAGAVPAPNTSSVSASDNCGTVTVSWVGDVISNQSCANRYTLTRTYKATDACGNSATCTQIITVNDDVAPTITCPAAITVKCAGAVPAPNTSSVTASDNCGAVTVSWVSDVISNQSCANRYTLTRTYKATDACGNAATCTQIITVYDDVAPTFTCPANKTILFNSTCGYNASPAAAGSPTNVSDNCGGTVTTTFTDVVNQCGNNIIITRTWKATDACGNLATCVQTITVTDNNTPYIIYAKSEAKFDQANTINGDVGVTDANGTADFKKNDVLDPYTVRAKNITVQSPASVNNKVFSPATGGPNPPFVAYVANPLSGSYTQSVNGTVPAGNYKNLTIKKNVVATVNGSDYGTVTIEENAVVTFTSNSINVEALQVKKGKNPAATTVMFTQCTGIKVKNSVSIDGNCTVNASGPKVTFYLSNGSFDVTGDNTQMTANILMQVGNLNVAGGNNPTVMTGWYIVEKLASGKNVSWNNYGCAPAIASRTVPEEPAEKNQSVIAVQPKPEDVFNVKAYPNPSSTDFTLQIVTSTSEPITARLMDVSGNVLKVFSGVQKGSVIKLGSELRPGTYLAEVMQGDKKQIVKLIKLN